jgi:Icc-related predicted phosphoesterase
LSENLQNNPKPSKIIVFHHPPYGPMAIGVYPIYPNELAIPKIG